MKRTPTVRQIKTLQLMSQGYTRTRAMREAGYSKSAILQGKRLITKSPTVQGVAGVFYPKLVEKGFTADFMADKFMEWLNAKKPFSSHTEPDREVPDYDVQMKAYDRAKELVNMGQSKGVKRKLTIEEFVTGEDAQ